ncbi:hypothetical protein CRI77_26500 [Mycolicibacterium duvalii]|uniref:Uncharacterized protein n=1 Tax=Mycolicibacterium duvalii TaxID=39688 RepID=A0A7I7K5Y9_9MYCO|nr:Ig-like domain-containing protein [Mycolicibacterium duvalii]MCV7365998.1 Ig-like domain-containing protein [Mycolicibacterium duvalii]PEG34816.1 hypothetical protein CRI77_26500 [Mycolicibacterium duvalii]BBX19443.1 hypothetical protein MDUV_43030 [Mycolicibacterium duvalii]
MAVQRGRHRATHHGAHRSQTFAVRRWLQLGAASAGMGAALLGYSLLGPSTGVAAADTESSVSRASSADSPRADRETRRAARADSAERADSDDRSSGSERTEAAVEVSDTDADLDAEADLDDSDLDDAADTVAEPEDAPDETVAPAARERRSHAGTDDSEARTSLVADSAAAQEISALQTADVPEEAPGTARQQRIARIIDSWTTRRQAWIDSLPVDPERKAELEASMWATRRALMNQTPTVAPIQVSGKLTGPIEGTIGAIDPDGDALRYVISVRPREGTVVINDDGTYTYTPDADFDGVDVFRVIAVDGWRINIFDPFRGLGTRARQVINQGAIKYAFTYTTGSEAWTPERREALERVADELTTYFVVERPVVLTFDVEGMDDAASSTLASAGSDLISGRAGFWRTTVQNKLLTGRDANGDKADGEIEFNFGKAWGYGDDVTADQYDFDSTALHELMHAFGFTAGMSAPGDNAKTDWSIYASYIVDEDGRSPFRFYRWNSAFDPNLEGAAGGLYFGGEHAVAAYGGYLVPLYTPDEWEQGSSMGHLDDATFTGDDQKLMNAQTDKGLGIRTLSAIEIGILRDLGYTVVPQTPHPAWALAGLVLIGRRRKKAPAQR